MTPEQRYDLAIEWRLTSSRMKEMIREDYLKKFGKDTSEEHWQQFLVKALNLEQFWKSAGLL